MNKIHSSQLFAILMLSAAWQVLCIPQARGGAQLIGIAAALGVQLLLSIPMLLLARGGFSFWQTIAGHRWLGILYVLFFLLWGAVGFSRLWEVSAEISLPLSGGTAAVLMVVTCLYTCSLGLKAMARCAPLMLGVLALSVLVLCIGAYSRVDITRLAPESEGFLQSGISYFCLCGELTAAFVLLDRAKGGQQRAVWGYLAGKAAFACLVVFLCICAAGRLAELSGYPFFTLTALSQPLQSQRADALYILVFVMLFVMHITLQTGVISHLLHAMFPKLRAAAPVSLAVMLLLSYSLPLTRQPAEMISGILIVLTAFAVPLLFYLNRRFSHEKTPPAPTASAAAASDGLRNGAHQ